MKIEIQYRAEHWEGQGRLRIIARSTNALDFVRALVAMADDIGKQAPKYIAYGPADPHAIDNEFNMTAEFCAQAFKTVTQYAKSRGLSETLAMDENGRQHWTYYGPHKQF